MRYFAFLFLLIPALAFADRVCLEKSTGKLIEMQSGNAPLGTLTQNAVNAGYKAEDVVEKYVNATEWEAIKKQWIDDPAKKITQDRANATAIKAADIMAKLKLTAEDLAALKEVLQAK